MSRGLTFRPATGPDLATVVSWVASESECLAWAGPAVSFPISARDLKAQIEHTPDNSFCLAEGTHVKAFGQLLRRGGRRFHMARIIAAPESRGQGFGSEICRRLIERAKDLEAEILTLNVYRDNLRAIELYRKLGFEPAPAPAGSVLPPDVVHMKLPRRAVLRATHGSADDWTALERPDGG